MNGDESILMHSVHIVTQIHIPTDIGAGMLWVVAEELQVDYKTHHSRYSGAEDIQCNNIRDIEQFEAARDGF